MTLLIVRNMHVLYLALEDIAKSVGRLWWAFRGRDGQEVPLVVSKLLISSLWP